MKLPPVWVQRKHKLFPCSTPSPVVTQSRRLLGKAKRQPSTRGGHSMLQRRSSLDLSHDRQVWTMSACLYSSHTWCLCMIGGVTKLLWTQPGSTCSRQKPDLSTPFYQPELHSTNQSCTAAACKTSNIPGWPCMGSGPGKRSRSSFSRVLGMEQESDARMGTDVDVTPRSGRVLLRVVKMRL